MYFSTLNLRVLNDEYLVTWAYGSVKIWDLEMLCQLPDPDIPANDDCLLFDPIFKCDSSVSLSNVCANDLQISFVKSEYRNHRIYESIYTLDFTDDNTIVLLEEMLAASPLGAPSRFHGQAAPPRRSSRIVAQNRNQLQLP